MNLGSSAVRAPDQGEERIVSRTPVLQPFFAPPHCISMGLTRSGSHFPRVKSAKMQPRNDDVLECLSETSMKSRLSVCGLAAWVERRSPPPQVRETRELAENDGGLLFQR